MWVSNLVLLVVISFGQFCIFILGTKYGTKIKFANIKFNKRNNKYLLIEITHKQQLINVTNNGVNDADADADATELMMKIL